LIWFSRTCRRVLFPRVPQPCSTILKGLRYRMERALGRHLVSFSLAHYFCIRARIPQLSLDSTLAFFSVFSIHPSRGLFSLAKVIAISEKKAAAGIILSSAMYSLSVNIFTPPPPWFPFFREVHRRLPMSIFLPEFDSQRGSTDP